MRRKKTAKFAAKLLFPLLAAAFLAWFCLSLGNLNSGQGEKGRQQLEDSLRRAAVTCYASEGIYPPDTDYIAEHYGVTFDSDRYVVFYDVFAENLMPDITVLIK